MSRRKTQLQQTSPSERAGMQEIAAGAYSALLAQRWWVVAVMVLLAGCTSAVRREEGTGPQQSAPTAQRAWEFGSLKGNELRTANYKIHSTIVDEAFNRKLAQVMEGARMQYLSLAPAAKSDLAPLECYVFANRREWAEFTRQRTGDDAAIYLQISRGGYTIRDFFVAYYIGDSGTFAVASHEGWHQFVSRHFKNRLPPFLEEGIATTFENISWTSGGMPRWNTQQNISRAQRLDRAIEERALWPLPTLLSMHAGDVVSQSPDKIEAFYAQNWAFARFLLEADNGRYRPALQRMLADAVVGQLYDPTRRLERSGDSFNPKAVQPMLEHYLGMNLDAIDAAYQTFLRKIATEERGEIDQ